MKNGLQLIPSTREDQVLISSIITNSEFYAEWDSQWGLWFLPEEEESYDELEIALDKLFAIHQVNYRIEGIF